MGKEQQETRTDNHYRQYLVVGVFRCDQTGKTTKIPLAGVPHSLEKCDPQELKKLGLDNVTIGCSCDQGIHHPEEFEIIGLHKKTLTGQALEKTMDGVEFVASRLGKATIFPIKISLTGYRKLLASATQ